MKKQVSAILAASMAASMLVAWRRLHFQRSDLYRTC